MDAARHDKVPYHLFSILSSRVPLCCFDLSYYSGSTVGALGAPFGVVGRGPNKRRRTGGHGCSSSSEDGGAGRRRAIAISLMVLACERENEAGAGMTSKFSAYYVKRSTTENEDASTAFASQ